MSRLAAGVLAFALAVPAPPVQEAAAVSSADLQAGITLVKEGDFEAAVLKLDTAIRGMEAAPAPQKDLATAYLYLGVAYLELDQEMSARARFRQALGRDATMRLDPRQFSPQVIRVFEATRSEPGTPAPAPSPPPAAVVAPPPTPASPVPPEKKGSKGALLILLGVAGAGGAAAAVAAGGGGGAAPTTVPPVADTPSTVPGPGPTTTTTPTTTTPTTTVPPAPSTTAPTTTTPAPPACTYQISGSGTFGAAGGSGVCTVTTNRSGCPWTAQSSDGAWLHVRSPGSGTQSGQVNYDVDPLLLGTRFGQVTLNQAGSGACSVEQRLLGVSAPEDAAAARWTSSLEVEGGEGQIVLDGVRAVYQDHRVVEGRVVGPGAHRLEAVLVRARGRPGSWRFTVEAGAGLRVLAGEATLVTPGTVVFRLAGAPGERVVLAVEVE